MNVKPKVIPELRQWTGGEGNFTITDKTRIIVNEKDFLKTAELFARDCKSIIKLNVEIAENTEPEAGDFYFTRANKCLKSEEYTLNIDDVLTVEADGYTGAYWATRSILQILKQTGNTIPKGIAKDQPKYRLRGFMLDVARIPVTLEFLKDLVKIMSWFKLNDLQVHLNDNVFTYTNGVPDYSGFRLESNIPNLTNTDVFYSKNDFRDFINSSKEMGVNIVPEFDSPGHSGAFTRVWPKLGRGYGTENYEGKYLDLENHMEEILEKIKAVFAEYTTGENPVFPKGTVVHIGTDEYKNGDKELFRQYQDQLLKYVRDELGYTPRVWGSQTENEGVTPITAEGVQMNLWYKGYADPQQMYELGYGLINTNDKDLYIVPKVDYYQDYLNRQHIYDNWQPNIIADFKVPEEDEQMLGACFCLWNDISGPKAEYKVTEEDMLERIDPVIPVFSAKLWGDIKDYSLEELDKLTEKVHL